MKKYFLFTFIFIIFLLFGCSISNEASIEGTWHVTHVLGMPVSSGSEEYYYKFNSDNSFYRDTDKSLLKAPSFDVIGNVIQSKSPGGFGSYAIENGYLSVEFSKKCVDGDGANFSYDAKYSGNTMYWYKNGIEMRRLGKE
jgi:hypothetical protein